MVQTTKYVCETCLSEFKTAAEAESCENAHVGMDSVVLTYEKGKKYPSIVTVVFEDEYEESYR